MPSVEPLCQGCPGAVTVTHGRYPTTTTTTTKGSIHGSFKGVISWSGGTIGTLSTECGQRGGLLA